VRFASHFLISSLADGTKQYTTPAWSRCPSLSGYEDSFLLKAVLIKKNRHTQLRSHSRFRHPVRHNIHTIEYISLCLICLFNPHKNALSSTDKFSHSLILSFNTESQEKNSKPQSTFLQHTCSLQEDQETRERAFTNTLLNGRSSKMAMST